MKNKPNTPNKSILECPQCGKPLVNIASKVERVHPVAKFITRHHFKIMLLMSFVSVAMTLLYLSNGNFERGMAFAWSGLILAPAVIMYFLLRMFSLYRITDCPHCGYHEKQRLGSSTTS